MDSFLIYFNCIHICTFLYIYIPQHNWLNLYDFTCMYVFRANHFNIVYSILLVSLRISYKEFWKYLFPLFLLTPSSIPPPLFMSLWIPCTFFCFIFNLPWSICAVHVFRAVRLFTHIMNNLPGTILLIKTNYSSTRSHQLYSSLLWGVEFLKPTSLF